MTRKKCMVIHKEAHRKMFAVPYIDKRNVIFMECLICNYTWEETYYDTP